jgi:hypothetical protein
VPHKLAYVAWMTIETVLALSAVAGIVWLLVTPSQATKSVSWREIPITLKAPGSQHSVSEKWSLA